MSSVNDVIKFINENKEFLPDVVIKGNIKSVIESGKISAEQALKKLTKVANKNKALIKDFVDEIASLGSSASPNNYHIEIPEPTKKDLNKDEETIKNAIINHNLEDKSLSIWFKWGSRVAFKDVKEVIYNKLNDFKTLDKAYFKIFYKFNGDKRNTTFSLNNERGMLLLTNLLKGDNFELLSTNNEDNLIIECSDTNKDNINAITYDMLTGIKFFNVDADQ